MRVNMKSIFVVFFLVLMMVGSADPIITVMGPYNITFDLGVPKDAYSIAAGPPTVSETLGGDIFTDYSLWVRTSNLKDKFAAIDINEIDRDGFWFEIPGDEWARRCEEYLRNFDPIRIESSARVIDRRAGGVAKGVAKNYTIYYSLFGFSRHAYVSIHSTFPWETGTLPLLKTIHITYNGTA